MGGSSAINGMMWTRGTIGQYDALEELGIQAGILLRYKGTTVQVLQAALLHEFLFNTQIYEKG